jgi:hypothetical protein
MVLARSRDGGRTVGAAPRVHADNWKITACPLLLRETTASELGPVRVLSPAVKAYVPDITVAPDGSAVVAGRTR